MTSTPKDRVKFVPVGILREPDQSFRHTLNLPDFIAAWDVWDYWERERLNSMQALLKPGDVLFDVGAEQGWMSALFAKFVGGAENLCLFEPVPEFWPNVKATFEANGLGCPRAAWCGLVGEKSGDHRSPLQRKWPVEAETGQLIDKTKYRYLHDGDSRNPEISIDEFVLATGIAPKGITIDVEGAELKVLQGAGGTLYHDRPMVWVSIHPGLALRDYNTKPEQIHELMRELRYHGEHLATDHEEHWVFLP